MARYMEILGRQPLCRVLSFQGCGHLVSSFLPMLLKRTFKVILFLQKANSSLHDLIIAFKHTRAPPDGVTVKPIIPYLSHWYCSGYSLISSFDYSGLKAGVLSQPSVDPKYFITDLFSLVYPMYLGFVESTPQTGHFNMSANFQDLEEPTKVPQNVPPVLLVQRQA